jgi:hypothetical protein
MSEDLKYLKCNNQFAFQIKQVEYEMNSSIRKQIKLIMISSKNSLIHMNPEILNYFRNLRDFDNFI